MNESSSPEHFYYVPESHPHLIEIYRNCTITDPNSSYFHEHDCGAYMFSGPTPGQPWWIQLIVQILYGIVCCVGLCGNTLVIYVVVRFSKMQTVTNLYLVNLAIADECFLVGIPFLMTTIGLGYWPFGTVVCKAYFTSTSINQITSSMFLLIMSADRYLAVCHPISSPRWRTPVIAKFVALTAWTLSALIMVPIYMYANTLEIDNKINCNIFWPSSETWTGESIFIVYSFIISFAIPLTLIMIFYLLVIFKLQTVGPKRRPLILPSQQPQPQNSSSIILSDVDRRNSAEPGSPSPPPPPNVDNHMTPQQLARAKDRKRSHRKVTKLVLTVISVYFICWVPYWLTQMALIFMPHDSNHSDTVLTLFLLAGCFSYSNSTMNPILYAFLSENFKKSFLKACTCAKGQKFFRFRFPNPVEMTQETTVGLSDAGGQQEDLSEEEDADDVEVVGNDCNGLDAGQRGSAFGMDLKNDDVNAQLQVENSVFPRGKNSKKKKAKRNGGVVGASGATSGAQTGQGHSNSNTGSAAGGIATLSKTAAAQASTSAYGCGGGDCGSKNLLQVPNSAFSKKGLRPDDEDEDESGSEEEEGASFLGSGNNSSCGGGAAYNGSGGVAILTTTQTGCGGGGLSARSLLGGGGGMSISNTPSTSTTTTMGGLNSNYEHVMNLDGVHVTSL